MGMVRGAHVPSHVTGLRTGQIWQGHVHDG